MTHSCNLSFWSSGSRRAKFTNLRATADGVLPIILAKLITSGFLEVILQKVFAVKIECNNQFFLLQFSLIILKPKYYYLYDCKSLKQYSYLRQVAHPPPRYLTRPPLSDPVRAACEEPGRCGEHIATKYGESGLKSCLSGRIGKNKRVSILRQIIFFHSINIFDRIYWINRICNIACILSILFILS